MYHFPKTCRMTALLLLLSTAGIAQQFEGNEGYFTRKGYKYTAGKTQTDTIVVTDPVTGDEMEQQRIREYLPLYANGKKVYDPGEVTTPAQIYPVQQPVEDYILAGLTDYFVSLNLDDFLTSFRLKLRNVVVDETGRIVFYELDGTHGIDKNGNVRTLSGYEALSAKINELISNAPVMKPATLNGVSVAAYTSINLHQYKITVQEGAIAYANDGNTIYER